MRIIKTNGDFLSSESTISTTTRKKFYQSNCEIFLFELHNFTLKKVLVENDSNALTEISNFLDHLYNIKPPNNFISIDQSFIDNSKNNELSLIKLLEKKDKPIYYTISEEEKLLSLNLKNFKIWFKDEINSILNVIEFYKIDGLEYDFPTNTSFVINCTVITDIQKKVELQRELYFFYKRVISIYSVIATDVIKSYNEIISFQMDVHDIKTEQYIDNLIKTYPNITFGARTSKGLSDILSKPYHKLEDLGNMVAKTLANLAPYIRLVTKVIIMFGNSEKKVNGQSFIRWIDDSLRTISSQIPIYYHPNLLCDYIDDVDEELVKFHVALDNGTLDYNKLNNSYQMLLKKFKKHKEEINKLSRKPLNENIYEPRNEMVFSDLFVPKLHPIFYTKNEEKLILSCSDNDFKAWFKNEICCILDFIDRYRKDNIKYDFPTSVDELRRRAEIKNTMNALDYEVELMHLYKRVLLVYSLIYSKYTSTTAFKHKIIMETNFLKQLLFSIAEEMDFRCMRISYFINSYNLYIKGNNKNQNLENLRDVLKIKADELKRLEQPVSEYFRLHLLEAF
ncbi:Hypothetical protein SRAE_X000012000 [Strongyloides ratti]|uniref:Uncharacterized protein n=1 Tax=Strongyloides ratti TaxID=34506 RepID=A0A090LT66_STRRB|nr:Hypothetical protein SRAE_X000012000 [Strongyloides ratti]CEF70789.1 Hypothetical protein SRAE_X000012000 [Strongyloides ratti]